MSGSGSYNPLSRVSYTCAAALGASFIRADIEDFVCKQLGHLPHQGVERAVCHSLRIIV